MSQQDPIPVDDKPRRDVPRWSEMLRDRSHVIVRPLLPEDREAERAFIEQLSAQACRFRFLGSIRHPSEQLLDELTRLDSVRDAAFAAVVAEDAHEKIIGVSRFSTDKDGLGCECAVVVDDEWQNRGLGTLLMRRLIEVARARGIRVMRSVDLTENVRMADLAQDLGFERRIDPDDATQVIHELLLAP